MWLEESSRADEKKLTPIEIVSDWRASRESMQHLKDTLTDRQKDIWSLYKMHMNQGFRFAAYPEDDNHIIVSHKGTPVFMIERTGDGNEKIYSISAIGEPSATSYITSVPADKLWEYFEQFNKSWKTLNDIISDIKASGIKWATETAQLMREIGNLSLKDTIKLWVKLSFTMVWGGYMSEIGKPAASYIEQLPEEAKKQILTALATGKFWSILIKNVRPR